jgi:hypothetical protein
MRFDKNRCEQVSNCDAKRISSGFNTQISPPLLKLLTRCYSSPPTPLRRLGHCTTRRTSAAGLSLNQNIGFLGAYILSATSAAAKKTNFCSANDWANFFARHFSYPRLTHFFDHKTFTQDRSSPIVKTLLRNIFKVAHFCGMVPLCGRFLKITFSISRPEN